MCSSGLQPQRLQSQGLDGAHQLGAAVEKLAALRTTQLDEDLGPLPIIAIRGRRIDRDAVLQAEATLRVEHLQEFVDLFGGCDFVLHGKFSVPSSRFSAKQVLHLF